MLTPPQSPTHTEFVYFRLKPAVKPEEAGNNREGERFLDLLHEITLYAGHLSSAWGRTEEDANNVVWVIGMYIYVKFFFFFLLLFFTLLILLYILTL
jgi:hypothetical protein